MRYPQSVCSVCASVWPLLQRRDVCEEDKRSAVLTCLRVISDVHSGRTPADSRTLCRHVIMLQHRLLPSTAVQKAPYFLLKIMGNREEVKSGFILPLVTH